MPTCLGLKISRLVDPIFSLWRVWKITTTHSCYFLVCTVSSSSRPGCRSYVLPLCECGFGGALLASNSVKSVHVSVTPTWSLWQQYWVLMGGQVVGRCIDSISSKTMVEPSKVDWSFTYTRSSSTAMSEHSSSNMSSSHWMSPVPRDWWVEDICGLDVELYWRLMVAVKAKGMPQEQIGESLRVYTLRWLPGVSKEQQLLLDGGVRMGNGGGGGFSTDHAETATKHRELLETIVSLLPSEKGSSSCSFLLKLLKAATILSASPTAKMELVRRIGLQLEDASLRDLLIPSLSYSSDSLYDVDLVQHIVEQYLASEKSPTTSPSNNGGAWRSQSMDRHRTQSIENFNFSERSSFTGHSSQLKVAKLIDSYLAEIARDTNLPLSKFVQLAESVPDFARPVHDKLYHAIDMYLQVQFFFCTLVPPNHHACFELSQIPFSKKHQPEFFFHTPWIIIVIVLCHCHHCHHKEVQSELQWSNQNETFSMLLT